MLLNENLKYAHYYSLEEFLNYQQDEDGEDEVTEIEW